jgi:MoaA/NifB/PqqE/SkfB family radical SAM enzyme|tara:strand:- start:2369 stop:3046 length:678 start_codon:yes stop_codon:yes gene_type:complete
MADVEPGIKGTCILNFEITSYCNADCPSCFRTREKENLSPYRHLQVEDFELLVLNNIDFFKNNQYHKLSAKFCGEIGDPLLHPNIEQLISIAEHVFDNIYIFTNGGIRNAKWIKKILKRYRKTIFVFGIDGLTDETNQMYRVNVRTDIALKNMIESVKHGFTKWHYTIFNHNYQELSDVITFAKKHNLDLLCRFNGREFNKLDDENIVKCEDLLQKNNIGYFVCR